MSRAKQDHAIWLIYAAPADQPITGNTMRLVMIVENELLAQQIVNQKQNAADHHKTNATFFYQDGILYRSIPDMAGIESFPKKGTNQ